MCGLAEASRVLGVDTSRGLRLRALEGLKLPPGEELGSGMVWSADAIRRLADGRTSARKPPRCVGLAEAAVLLEMPRANVRKWCERRGLVARELAQGPVWRRSDVEGALWAWRQDTRAQAVNEKRRASARRGAARGGYRPS